jgi:superfamily II DNA or RNA helicase
VLNNADELWQYLHMVDRNTYPSFKRWVEEHFDVEYTSFHGKLARPVRVVGDILPGHEEILRWQLAGTMIQREIGELFPGEPWVEEPEHIVIDVDLSAAERKAYDQLVKHQWVGLDSMTVSASNRLALSTRLQQLSSDWGTIDATLPEGTKVKAGAEIIGDLARRETVVAFAKYTETVQRLADAVSAKGYSVRTWTGGNEDEHEKIRVDYARGEVDVVVGTLASLGEGVDGFQYRGSSIVMLDRGWTPASNDQPIGRRRRSGQTKRVFVYHVMGRNTIDAIVVRACLRKENVASTISDRPLKDTIYGVGVEL